MAEEKPKEKESRSTKRYGHGPKIEPKEHGGDTDKKATPKEVSTEGAPEGHMGDKGPKASVETGTEGIPVNDRHAAEREAMMHRHVAEHHEMHHRHMAEHRQHGGGEKEPMHTRHEHERKESHNRHMGDMRAMHDRHEAELGGGAESVATEKHEGKTGTEPSKKAA